MQTQTALRLLDKDMMDKQRALDAALGQIERAFGKGSIMKLGSREAASDIDVISTGSFSGARGMVIFTTKIRRKLGTIFGSPDTTPGGNALNFYASVRLDIRRI